MDFFKNYTSLIDNAIRELPMKGGALAGLYDPIAYGLDAGGKRIRPVLTLIACQASCGTPNPAIPAALAVEMFHNFTLLHDDVMDNSPTRRGKPSVFSKYGLNAAVLSGDTMLSMAMDMLCRLPDSALRAALECFNRHTIEVYEGQQMDIDFESRDNVTVDEYLEMIRLKTSVLLGCAAKLGAISGAATPMEQDLWYRYAEALGLAFQIQDDRLDVYGDPATFGKPIGGDILNNKKTWLLLTALDSPVAACVREVMAMDPSAEKIDAMRRLYDEAGVPELCAEAIAGYTHEALLSLDALTLPAAIHTALADFTSRLADRQK